MLSVWTLLATAICAVSVSAVSHKFVTHGHQLSLNIFDWTKKLDFASADEKEQYTVWEKVIFQQSKARKGEVISVSKGRAFIIRRATFDDEGTYTLYSYFGFTTTYIVRVETNIEVIDRIAGETLTIPLSGLNRSDATLNFYGNYSSVTLVKNGILVGRNHPKYIRRLEVTSYVIQILNVNVLDLGRYELTDLKGRLVSNNTMILVDHHDYTPNKGLIALLLLGISAGICYSCGKRICRRCRTTKSYTHTGQPNAVPVSIPCSYSVGPVVPVGPVAPDGPGNPGQDYIAGYPPHPDQGQIHYPYPTQPSGQPTVPLNSNYTPIMNSTPPAREPTELNTNELPPTVPLLTPQSESQPSVLNSISMDVLNSSDTGVQFDINKGKSSGNSLL